MAGMVLRGPLPERSTRRSIGASMFGVTTPCVTEARRQLDGDGFETLVFHMTGVGGRALEQLIRQGWVDGVLDVTTTELADELVGGVFSAGPERLTGAAAMGVPQVVSVGALDMVNFGPVDTVPSAVRRSPTPSAQRGGHADADDTRRMRGAGSTTGAQGIGLHRSGRRLSAPRWRLDDRDARRAVLRS